MKRYFEFPGADEKRGTSSSSKFWEVWIEGSTLYTRFGKIGANGQTTIKEFPSIAAAEAGRAKSIAEKLKKGYVEGGRSGESIVKTTTQSRSPNHSSSLERARNPKATAEDLKQLFQEFQECALEEKPCLNCDTDLDIDLVEDALGILASNPSIDSELLDSVIESAMEWQGKIVSLVPCVAGNPSITEEGKSLVLSTDVYMWQVCADEPLENYAEDYVKRVSQAMRNNPEFSDEECIYFAQSAAAELSERGRAILPGEIFFDLDEYPKILDLLETFYNDGEPATAELLLKVSDSTQGQPTFVALEISGNLLIRVGHDSKTFTRSQLFFAESDNWVITDERELFGEKIKKAHGLSLPTPTLGKAYAAVCESIWPLKEAELTISQSGKHPGGKFCSQCGSKRRDGARFCSECGQPISEASLPEASQEDPSEANDIAVWMVESIRPLPTSRNLLSVEFQSREDEHPVLGVTYSDGVFDFAFWLDEDELEEILGDGYAGFTEPDDSGVLLAWHYYLEPGDFEEIALNLLRDLVVMIGGSYWTAHSLSKGLLGDKQHTDKWGG
jgi:predicted DNA-binding WGR domain protein